jgi:hypothetical protein
LLNLGNKEEAEQDSATLTGASRTAQFS